MSFNENDYKQTIGQLLNQIEELKLDLEFKTSENRQNMIRAEKSEKHNKQIIALVNEILDMKGEV